MSLLHAVGMVDFVACRISDLARTPPKLPALRADFEGEARRLIEARESAFGQDVAKGFAIAENSLRLALAEIQRGARDRLRQRDGFLLDVILSRELPYYLDRGASRMGDQFPKEAYERSVLAYDKDLAALLPIAMKELGKTDYVSESPGFHPAEFWWRQRMWELLVSEVGEDRAWSYIPGWEQWRSKIGTLAPRPWRKDPTFNAGD